MSAPLVSILTPSFQQARWLGDNLRSVKTQTYSRVEHLVMDGGSTDGTRALLESGAHPGLRWWSEEDRGQSHAVNKAFDRSHGDIIGWLNSDDAYFAPTVIAEVVRAFAHRPDLSVVYGHAALVNADGLILHFLWAPPFSRRLLKLHDFIAQPAAFIRRSALDSAMVDESFEFAMDYELWLRLARRRTFGRLNRVLAIDRHHGARKSSRMLDVMQADLERLQRRYGIDAGPGSTATRKAWKIAARFAGATIIPSALQQDLAFVGHVDSGRALLRRQIGMRRAAMPMTGRSGGRSP